MFPSTYEAPPIDSEAGRQDLQLAHAFWLGLDIFFEKAPRTAAFDMLWNTELKSYVKRNARHLLLMRTLHSALPQSEERDKTQAVLDEVAKIIESCMARLPPGTIDINDFHSDSEHESDYVAAGVPILS